MGSVAMEANWHQDFQWVQVHQVRQLGAGSSFLALFARLSSRVLLWISSLGMCTYSLFSVSWDY